MRKLKMRWRGLLALLPLALAAALHRAEAQSPARNPSPQELIPGHSDGSYLHSYLVAPKPEGPCPPNIDAVYQADVIVTGTDMRQRPWGFAQTFRTVLVKSSGDPRLMDDQRVAELAAHAADFVVCFLYADMMADIPVHDEQGTYDRPHKLTVTFDPAKIDAILADFGDKPWHGERPLVLPVLLVTGPKPPSYVLSADAPRGTEQRGAFAAAAEEFGIMVRFPSDKELTTWAVSATQFPGETPGSRAGEAIVTGTLEWNESLPGWVGKWRTDWQGAAHRWEIGGVNYDAAFRDIVRGVVLLASGRGSPD
jgi:hypothetical protein